MSSKLPTAPEDVSIEVHSPSSPPSDLKQHQPTTGSAKCLSSTCDDTDPKTSIQDLDTDTLDETYSLSEEKVVMIPRKLQVLKTMLQINRNKQAHLQAEERFLIAQRAQTMNQLVMDVRDKRARLDRRFLLFMLREIHDEQRRASKRRKIIK